MKRIQPVILLLAAMTLFLFYRQSHRQSFTEGITRAQTARMLAWTVCDMNKDRAKSVEPLIDVDSTLWYADEITTVLAEGIMKKDGDLFHPIDYLTWEEASNIADFFDISLSIPVFQKRKPIPLEKWLQFFDRLLAEQDIDIKLIKKEQKILAVPSASDTLDRWQVKTDSGIYSCEGLALEKYLDQTVTAYIYQDQLLMAVPADPQQAEIITASTSVDTDNTKAAEAPSESFSQNDPLPAASAPDIRVCIMNDDFSSEAHKNLRLTSDAAWQLTFHNKVIQYPADEVVELNIDDFSEDGETAEAVPENHHCMTILSINRSCGNPSYSGRLQIMRSKDALFLINILPTETYLKGVVPSEMPASYHLEALKAQAVCARSYALSAVKNPKYDFADLNDSTSCQVYMNQGTDTQTDLAVDATAGEVLSSRQKIVTAKYFSSSCGSLSSSDDIWGYPDTASQDTHMTERLETEPPGIPALSSEEAFRNFIFQPAENTYLESSDPWFRWQTELSMAHIRSNIAESFAKRMSADPKRFTVLSSDGTIDPDDISQIKIVKRAESGVLQKIKLTGRNQELTVSGEYNIRCLLVPSSDTAVILQDKSTRNGMSLLPSGYFFLEEINDGEQITGYKIYGGGFGHGAGLSQNGADTLAEKGYDYREILTYFFEGINIENVNTLE